MVAGQELQMVLTLTYNDIPRFTKVFSAVNINGKIKYAEPASVDAWADNYLDITNGFKININVAVERKVGINPRVYQAYTIGSLVDTVVKSEWVTDLQPIAIGYQGEN